MTERPAPPPLEYRTPLCSVCGTETRHSVNGRFFCDACGCGWDDSIIDLEGEWENTASEQCTATVRPYEDNTWIPEEDERKHLELRCIRDAGHCKEDELGEPQSLHAHPELITFAKGWA
ncbi:hypothetical protein [Amycolatopsis sp. NPDC049159]|uniref:hypothetical protein n=1 Tax=Amycolatopsis sp. NPDC049159 TaxID=3157210 RepID=UPI003400980A